jgi:FKBP-type peptidyl-prolyl cis-trans isomerase (trigger factor)
LVGINTLIPEIDQGLVGKKADNKTKKINFKYSDQSPSQFAGMEAVYEYKIKSVLAPKFKTIEDIFKNANGKQVEGYRNIDELRAEFEESYQCDFEDNQDEIYKESICKQLISSIPDFELDDSFAKEKQKEAKVQIKALAKTSTEVICKVQGEFGTFEGNVEDDYATQVYEVSCDITKLECILSYLFIKYSNQIKLVVDEQNYMSDEELQKMALEEEPTMTDLEQQHSLGFEQLKQNRHKALDWLLLTLKVKNRKKG